jgi:hypothetical protein
MADTFRVQLRQADVDRAIEALQSRAPVAIARAINKSADSGKVVLVREMSRDVGTKVSDMREQVTISPARPERLSAQIIATGARIPLIDFQAKGPYPSRGRGKGVTYRIGSARKTLAHAFIARMSSGHKGVFERTPGKFMRTRPRRQAIHEKFGPSLPRVFRKFIPVATARVQEQLPKNISAELRFELSKQRQAS